MALTPEDVVNKRFQPTKFREGYDQDEVDDFLDEVVIELRRLNQENDELKQRIAELEQGGAVAAPVADAAPAEPVSAVEQPAVAEPVAALPEPVAAPVAAIPEPVAAPEPVVEAAAPVADETESTNNLLQLARRLHDEHVREGIEKRDALIAEGNATAARIVAEAETKQRAQIAVLEQEKGGLEQKIDGLRSFEKEYRSKLKSYIEGQLHDLDASGTGIADAPSTASTPVAAEANSFQGFGA